MELASLAHALGSAWTLAKEIGKGGGGSTEEPTVCMVLLPIAAGVLAVGFARLRQRILGAAWRKDGRSGPGFTEAAPERKVQTA